MNPTQTVAEIITRRLTWEVVDSTGKPARKPEGQNELITLLAAHKAGLTIVVGEPGVPLVVRVQVSGGVAECVECPPGVVCEIVDHDNLEEENPAGLGNPHP